MSTSGITKTRIWEDSDATHMARVVGSDAAAVTQATVSSISQKVFNLTTGSTTAVATAALVVADTIFDTLQTDARWTVDTTGYNFRTILAGTVFSTGDTLYGTEYVYTLSDGSKKTAKFEDYAQAVTGS